MSDRFVFAPPPVVSAPIRGTEAHFPVRRIYCVGRNYSEHVREMGLDPGREPPFFFAKPADALADGNGSIDYPPQTRDLQHEVELVIAIGKPGRDVPREAALDLVYGYAVGVDLTRRDTQVAARKAGRPWEHGKSFDQSAPMGAITPALAVGTLADKRIWLNVGTSRRQDAELSRMVWSVPEIVSILSSGWELHAGDLIFTGTPAGIGPLVRGDVVSAGIDGIDKISFTIR